MKLLVALMLAASLSLGLLSFIPSPTSCASSSEDSMPSDSNQTGGQSCELSGHADMTISGTCLACIDMLLPDHSPQPDSAFAVDLVEIDKTNGLSLPILPWQPPV